MSWILVLIITFIEYNWLSIFQKQDESDHCLLWLDFCLSSTVYRTSFRFFASSHRRSICCIVASIVYETEHVGDRLLCGMAWRVWSHSHERALLVPASLGRNISLTFNLCISHSLKPSILPTRFYEYGPATCAAGRKATSVTCCCALHRATSQRTKHQQ